MSQELPLTDSAASAVIPTVPRASLWANASWTLGGNIVYAGCQGVWLILLAKMVTDGSTGDFILALTIATPVLMLTSLSLRYMLATDVGGEFNFTEYLILRLVMTTLGMAIIVLIPTVGHLLGLVGTSTVLVISAVGAAKAIESISEIIFGKFQNHERMDLIGLSMTLKGVFSLAGMGLGLSIIRTALGAALGLGGAWIGVLLLFDVPQLLAMSGVKRSRVGVGAYLSEYQSRSANNRDLVPRLVQLGKRSVPLAFANTIYTLNPNIVMYFTRVHVGDVLFGIFGTLQYLTVAGNMIFTAIGAAVASYLARCYADRKYSDFRRLLLQMIMGAVVLGLLGVGSALLFGPWLLSVLFRPDYRQYSDVLAWLMGASSISYVAILLGFACTATRTFHRFTIPYLGISIVALTASALLVPRFGMIGAALAFGTIHLAAVIAFSSILLRAGIAQLTPNSMNTTQNGFTKE